MSCQADFYFKNMSPSKALADYLQAKLDSKLDWPPMATSQSR